MITAEQKQRLEELKSQVNCPKKLACIYTNLGDLCEGQYHSETDILECLEPNQAACKFVRPFGCTIVCICPLRKYIAKNFPDWSENNTSLLRPEQGKS